MSEYKRFIRVIKTTPKSDWIVMVITFLLTVIFDLVIAIEVGMILAALFFLKRMSEESRVTSWKYIDSDKDDTELKAVPENVRVYELSGPMFFGVADKILDVTFKDYTDTLILRMRAVTAIDATAMNSLEGLLTECEKRGIRLIISHANEQPLKVMKKSGFYDRVGEENFCGNIDKALKKAEQPTK